MLNNGFVSLDELIQAAKKAEDALWKDIQTALRKTGSSKTFSDLKDFLTTANFEDVGASI